MGIRGQHFTLGLIVALGALALSLDSEARCAASCKEKLCFLDSRDVVRGEIAADGRSLVVTEVVVERFAELTVGDEFSVTHVRGVEPGPAIAYITVYNGVVSDVFPLSGDGHLLCNDSPMTGPGLTVEEMLSSPKDCSERATDAGYTVSGCNDVGEASCAMGANATTPAFFAWALAGVGAVALRVRRRRRWS